MSGEKVARKKAYRELWSSRLSLNFLYGRVIKIGWKCQDTEMAMIIIAHDSPRQSQVRLFSQPYT